MNGVELRNIDKGYGHVRVLKDLSLDMAPGSFTVLLGPSGCGKSTLLACIAGLDEVDAGTIRIGPRDVTELEPKDRRIAMVFQNYALYPTMSVRRNMSFGLEVARMPRAEIDQRVARAAAILQLEPLLDRKPAQLSGGQRQRAAIGRALVRDADVFLFDEPLSNLDAKLRVEMRMEIKRLHERLRTTMIYVTHDQVEAMTLASMIAVMNGGVIEQVADPQTLYDRPETLFVARFVGSPAMSLIEGRLAGDAVEVGSHRIPIDGYQFQQRVEEGRPVVLGIRPERVGAGGRANGAWPVSLPLDITEPMGADTLAWFDLDGQRLAARLDPEVARGAAGHVALSVDLTNASLFDQGSGHRL